MSRVIYGQVVNGRMEDVEIPGDIVNAKVMLILMDEETSLGDGHKQIVFGEFAHLPGSDPDLADFKEGRWDVEQDSFYDD